MKLSAAFLATKSWAAEGTVWFVGYSTNVTYAEAKENCATLAEDFADTVGHPSFFRSEREYRVYLRQVREVGRREWLGYEQQNDDADLWLNADGSEVTFSSWDSGQPNYHHQDCVITGYKGEVNWHDVGCNDPMLFSCRFESSSLTTTSTSTTSIPTTGTTTSASTTSGATTPIVTSAGKVRFVMGDWGVRVDYSTAKAYCADLASNYPNTVGYPSFFRNELEWEQYSETVDHRREWLGYEQQNGDKQQWLNADGSEVTFISWDSERGQPNYSSQECSMTGYAFNRDFDDVPCDWREKYSCRLEELAPSQYAQRIKKINGHLNKFLDDLETTKFTQNYSRKMLKKVQELEASVNEDGSFCDRSEQEDEGEDVQAFDGTTDCKRASQITRALVSASRKWACAKGSADRLVRHFNKFHRQFKNRMCSEE